MLELLLRSAGIETRWIAEINVHPPSTQRQSDSEALFPEHGSAASVFGYQHNDHRWLELHDPTTDTWIPADATLAVVGMSSWVRTRLGFGTRPALAAEMIVPFCIVVLDLDRVLHANRTDHYLIDGFNRSYDGQLEQLLSWPEWSTRVNHLGDLGAKTFTGSYNLHDGQALINGLLETYLRIAREADSAGIR